MLIKKFEHHLLKEIANLDIHDDESKKDLIKNLIFKTIKKRLFFHFLLILITFGYHYIQLQKKMTQSIEEALFARKLNTMISLQNRKALIPISTLKKIYSKKELELLKCQPITEYQLMKTLYFHSNPLKYKKIWKSLFFKPSLEKSPDMDSINLFYEQLKSKHAIPNEEITKYLKNKMEGRHLPTLSAKEIQSAFKELADSKKAS